MYVESKLAQHIDLTMINSTIVDVVGFWRLYKIVNNIIIRST